jgi:hypothetical protein
MVAGEAEALYQQQRCAPVARAIVCGITARDLIQLVGSAGRRHSHCTRARWLGPIGRRSGRWRCGAATCTAVHATTSSGTCRGRSRTLTAPPGWSVITFASSPHANGRPVALRKLKQTTADRGVQLVIAARDAAQRAFLCRPPWALACTNGWKPGARRQCSRCAPGAGAQDSDHLTAGDRAGGYTAALEAAVMSTADEVGLALLCRCFGCLTRSPMPL